MKIRKKINYAKRLANDCYKISQIALLTSTFALMPLVASKIYHDSSRLEQKILQPDETKKRKNTAVFLSNNNVADITKVVYCEAADQPSETRQLVVKTILNRIKNPNYRNNVSEVIYEKGAFSCMNNGGNKNWNQATGKLEMNEYEKEIFKECFNDVISVLRNGSVGIENEEEIIAYHDKTVKYRNLIRSKKHREYWINLEPVHVSKDLTFYANKKELRF